MTASSCRVKVMCPVFNCPYIRHNAWHMKTTANLTCTNQSAELMGAVLTYEGNGMHGG